MGARVSKMEGKQGCKLPSEHNSEETVRDGSPLRSHAYSALPVRDENDRKGLLYMSSVLARKVKLLSEHVLHATAQG